MTSNRNTDPSAERTRPVGRSNNAMEQTRIETTEFVIPGLLREIAPSIGSIWEWEPLIDHARATLKVTDVKWNGEELWIETQNLHKPHAERSWNELSRWVEAAVLLNAPDED
jgi:hypothetical protein